MKDLPESSSREDLLKDKLSKDALYRETLQKDFSPDELFPDETLPKDLSFEYEDLFAAEDKPTKGTSSKDNSVEDKPTKGTSPQEDLETAKDPELPDIGRDIKKSLQAVMQWCDDTANTPNNIVTNFKSHLPFLIFLGGTILLLWVLRLIYG